MDTKKEVLKFLQERLKEAESYKKAYDKKQDLSFPDDLSYKSTLRDISAFEAAIHYVLKDIDVIDAKEVLPDPLRVSFLEVCEVLDYDFEKLPVEKIRLIREVFHATLSEVKTCLSSKGI